MPDVTFTVRDLKEDAERLDRAVSRLGFVNLTNVDAEKGILAVSYEGGESELGEIEAAIREAGFEFEAAPGTRRMAE